THGGRLTYLGDGQNIDWFEVISGEPTVEPTATVNGTPTVEPTATSTIVPTTTSSGKAPYRDHPVPGRIQAEDYDMGGPGVAYSDSTPENKGGAYRLSEAVDVESMQGGGYNIGYITNGEWVEYTLNVPEARTYQAAFRVGSWFSGTRQIRVSVGGVERATVNVPVTGKDYLYETVTVPLALDAGTQVIRLTFVGEKQNIDYFELSNGSNPSVTPTVTPSATVTPTPTATVTIEPTVTQTPGRASIPGRVEAENYDDGPAGVSYRDLTPGNQGDYTARNPTDVDLEKLGTGATVAYIRTGEWLIYTLNVAETNNYNARFRVASWIPQGTTPGQRSIMVRIDDQSEKAVNVPLTGGSTVYDIASIPVYLTAGEHEIGLRFVGWYQNFDWMEFVPAN
ncbi:MAG TPA: carbohydrate-binding protein, partial [Methanoregulaceae archaeon]|nr:carbohydrate-binding protein [Methanoregulaceae archaeon]